VEGAAVPSTGSGPTPAADSTRRGLAGPAGGGLLTRLVDQATVQFGGEHVDRPGELGVGLELQFLLSELVVAPSISGIRPTDDEL